MTGLTSTDYSYSFKQNSINLNEVKIILLYTADLQNKKLAITYSQSRRLQQDVGSSLSPHRMLTISFSSTFNVETYPPAIYYPPATSTQFSQLQYDLTALSICLLVLSFILVPKKMHLHALTVVYLPAQIFIAFGLVADSYTDWIKFSVSNLTYSALIGGFSFGKCCTTQSTYFNLSSELMSLSAIVLFVLLLSWGLFGLTQYFDSRCLKIESTLKTISYFIFTITFALLFTIIFSSVNTLYHFTLLTPNDTFNTVLGLLLSIFFLLLVVVIWIITYQTVPSISKNDKTVHVDK